MPDVYVAVPVERTVQEHAFNAFLKIAEGCGRNGYHQILWPMQRVDVARNGIVKMFMSLSKNLDDTLVMLDCDHAHPPDIIDRLVAHNVGVVGALCFTRGAPYKPCFFVYQNGFHVAMKWNVEGLIPCDAVGTGAIAIQRWVFEKLAHRGPYFFRGEYLDELPDLLPPELGVTAPSDDMWFATLCMEAGIKHHVDTSLVSPHLKAEFVGQAHFLAFEQLEAEKEPA